jgi:hypothetical protein
MGTETAIETRIEPQLVDAFGRRVANSLLTSATVCYAITNGNARERYRAFVQSICSDDRVVSAWGEQGVARQKEEWEALVATLSN